MARYATNTPIVLADELVDGLKTLPTNPKDGNTPPLPDGDDDDDGPEPLGEKPVLPQTPLNRQLQQFSEHPKKLPQNSE